MGYDETTEIYMALAMEMDIPENRLFDVWDLLKGVLKKKENLIVVYNTLTANLTEKEIRLAFYIWGNIVGLTEQDYDEGRQHE